MSFNHHISQVCVKLARVCYLLRELRSVLSVQYLLTTYHALFHSHVAYGIVVWGHSTSTRDILLLQKRALRIITNAGHIDHCRPIFRELKVLTVTSQYVYNILTAIKDNLGSFGKREEQHSYGTRRRGELDLPRYRLNLSQKAYPYSAMKIFNTLPEGIRNLDSTAFRTRVKTLLINRPLYSLQELIEEPLGDPG